MEPGQDSYVVSYEEGYVGVHEEGYMGVQEEFRMRDGMSFMSGSVLKQQVIPFNTMLVTENTDIVPISKLSGIIYTKPTSSSSFSDVVAIIGDGGFIYHARLLPASSENIVEFINVTKLRFPPAYSDIDAEAITLHCGKGDPYQPEECRYIVSSETGKSPGSNAMFFEYSISGQLRAEDPLSLATSLEPLGLAGKHILKDKGYKAVALSENHQHMVFMTEGPLDTDSKDTRRILYLDMMSRELKVFKYIIQNAEHGISDLTLLTQDGSHVLVIERKGRSSKLYHFRVDEGPSIAFNSVNGKMSESELTTRFSKLEPIPLLDKSPIFDGGPQSGNYEGVLLTHERQVLLISDNNDDDDTSTVFTLLNMSFHGPPTPSPTIAPTSHPTSAERAFGQILIFVLIACVVLFFGSRVARGRARSRGNNDELDEEERQKILSQDVDSVVELQHTGRSQAQRA